MLWCHFSVFTYAIMRYPAPVMCFRLLSRSRARRERPETHRCRLPVPAMRSTAPIVAERHRFYFPADGFRWLESLSVSPYAPIVCGVGGRLRCPFRRRTRPSVRDQTVSAESLSERLGRQLHSADRVGWVAFRTKPCLRKSRVNVE